MAEIVKARLVALGEAKLADAKLLLASGSPGNAYYLAGYAVELMLKAILSSRFKTDTLPDRTFSKEIFVHNLAKLVQLADLNELLSKQQDDDERFNAAWRTVSNWTESSRYDDIGFEQANSLILAIANEEYGVLPWLRRKL